MIKSISFRNFRGIPERLLEFGPGVNYLRGPNEAGKSGVKELIMFALMGTDSSGQKSPDHLISEGFEVTEASLTTDKATFIRKKKRGTTSEVKLLRDGFPPLGMNQTELSALLKMDADLLGSCHQVGYFMSLPAERQLQVITAVAKLDRFSILDEMLGGAFGRRDGLPKNVKLVNPRIDADAVARDRRVLGNQLANDEGGLQMLESELLRLSDSDIDEDSYQKRVNELTAVIDLHDRYRVNLATYEQQLLRAQEAERFNAGIEAERRKYEDAIKELGPKPVYDEAGYAELLGKLLAEKGHVVKQYRRTPVLQKTSASLTAGSCGVCKQPVSQEWVASQAQARAKEIEDFNKLEREIADHNIGIADRENYLTEEYDRVRAEADAKKEAVRFWERSTSDFNERILRLKPVTPTVPVAPEKPQGDVAAMKAELVKLQTDLSVHRLNRTKRAEVERKRAEMDSSAMAKRSQIDSLKKLEDALRRLPEKEVEEMSEKLKLSNAVVRFTDGVLVVTDTKGVPYGSLSTGRRKKLDFEWCKRIQQLMVHPPKFYFLDDADLLDSIMEHLPKDSQVFVAKVDPTLKELQVSQV